MKKSAIIFMLCLSFLAIRDSYGQDSIKATKGNFLTELNVNLFQGEITLNNVLNQVKLRYFVSDALALRVGFNYSSKKEVSNYDVVYGQYPYKNNETMKSSLLGINVGIEKHFRGTKRLSPYIGGEFTVGYKTSEYEKESQTLTTTVKGAWMQYETYRTVDGYYVQNNSMIERGFLSYGLNIVTGFDFYMAKHLFIGYEMELGFSKKKYSDIEISYSGTDAATANPGANYDDSEFSFGPKIINGIRIGYVF